MVRGCESPSCTTGPRSSHWLSAHSRGPMMIADSYDINAVPPFLKFQGWMEGVLPPERVFLAREFLNRGGQSVEFFQNRPCVLPIAGGPEDDPPECLPELPRQPN